MRFPETIKNYCNGHDYVHLYQDKRNYSSSCWEGHWEIALSCQLPLGTALC